MATGTSTTIKFDNSVDPALNDLFLDNVVVTKGTSYLLDNTAPLVTAPTSLTLFEDQVGNLLFTSTAFSDAATSLTVTLTVTEGTLSATGDANVTVGGSALSRTFTGSPAALNTFFSTAGKITYQGAANASGNKTLSISVVDTAGNTSSASTILALTAVNDAPSGADATITVLEDGSKTFAASDFGFSDTLDSNTLSAVIISTLPTTGTLKLNGVDVTFNQSIAAASIGNLVYAPAANANGSAYATIGFKVQDNGGTSNSGADTSIAKTLTLNVTAVNEAPTVTLAKDILVNTATIGHQLAPKSAALVSGGVDAGHVQVWASQQQGSERWYVFGQRYDANGL
ncbi:hypothetical protein B9Z45_16575, partial [Limnohabitans sp. 2KL-17]